MSIDIRIDKNAFPAMRPLLRKKVSQVVRKTAEDIEANAKVLVPVDTGALKGSIGAKPVSELTWEVAVGMEYAAPVEFGHTRITSLGNEVSVAGRPYLTPSVEQARKPFEQAIAAAVKAAADEAENAG